MRCIVCEKYSLKAICKSCIEKIYIKLKTRVLGDFKVYSFYDYEEISFLLATKYYAIGSRVIFQLAKKASLYLMQTQLSLKPYEIYGMGIDDNPRKSYSHTGVILRAFKEFVIPIYGELHAKNIVQYAGKNLDFRQKNPKNFSYKSGIKDIIIFDDVITTGTSMLEARKCIQKYGGNALFGIVLSDARILY